MCATPSLVAPFGLLLVALGLIFGALMLIVVLNKKFVGWFLGLAVGVLGAGQAKAHGDDGGLDFKESAVLYGSFMQAFGEASGELNEVVHELELKYRPRGPLRPESDIVSTNFLNERIELRSPAFAKLLDRSLDIFKARMKKECPECFMEQRTIGSEAFRSRALAQLKLYIRHQLGAVTEAIRNPKSLSPKAMMLVADGARLFAFHGLFYVLYTGVTEAIESVFMGPFHWACPFFQALYLPVAFLSQRLWNPLISVGQGLGLRERVGVSMRMIYLLTKFRAETRRLAVEAQTTSAPFLLRHEDYRERIAGIQHHIEEELNYKTFWAEIYRNFHMPHTAPQHDVGTMDLARDFDVIFGFDSAESGKPMSSEAERLYVAVKQNDGLGILNDLITKMSAELYQSQAYSDLNFIKLSLLLGDLGALLKNYGNLLMVGALSSRSNPEVQIHQRSLAEPTLKAVKKFLLDIQPLLDQQQISEMGRKYVDVTGIQLSDARTADQLAIRHHIELLSTNLQASKKVLQRGLRTFPKFKKLSETKSCSSLMKKLEAA